MKLEEAVEAELKTQPMRTIESVKREIIYQMANKTAIVGRREISQGITSIIELRLTDKEFDAALELIAGRIIGLFPNVTPGQSENNEHLN